MTAQRHSDTLVVCNSRSVSYKNAVIEIVTYYYYLLLLLLLLLLLVINFICQPKHKTDCNTTEYNMVKYVEQDREAQKCSYLAPRINAF